MAERLDDLAASFRRHLRAEGRSERTTVIYGQAIRFFIDWLTAHGRPATTDELTRSAVRAWLAELADTREPSTVRTRYKGLRRFARWLVDEGELEADPMEKLEVPQTQDKPVPIITDVDLAAAQGVQRQDVRRPTRRGNHQAAARLRCSRLRAVRPRPRQRRPRP